MVGEGVPLECLDRPDIERVLIVNRKPYPLQHQKLAELIGAHTNSSENGRQNTLMRLPFKQAYCFLPGFMRPTAGQRNVKWFYTGIGSVYPLRWLLPNQVSTISKSATR